jgi:hypothetical protein
MTESIDTLMEYCKQCEQSLVPLKTIHVKRPCKECGQSFYIFEPGENGQGMQVRKGDQPIIPPGAIRISLDFEQTNGRFSRQGLPWFAQMLFFQGQAQTPDEVSLTLNTYYSYALQILESSHLVKGLDINTEEGLSEFDNRLKANKNSSEWWAAWVINGINCLIENPKIEDKEIQSALWEMNKITNFHSMLIFKEMLEKTIWSGYMINNLKDILKIWNDNQENSDEEFWQKVFWNNSIVLSQVFSFPVIFIEDKAYVGGKNINDKGGNVVDFLLANNLTKNTALVEIKTPKTKIIGTQYRTSVYSISADLTGAIVQISNYKDSLTKEYHTLVKDEENKFNAFNPQCVVIAGNGQTEMRKPEHIKSFELFRNGLKDVQIITYDELFRKIEILIELIEGKKT